MTRPRTLSKLSILPPRKIEILESRFAPAQAASIVGTQLQVFGTSAADALRIHQNGSVTEIDIGNDNTIDATFNNSDFSSIAVFGQGGNDLLILDVNLAYPVTLNGGDGTDTITVIGDTNFSLNGTALTLDGRSPYVVDQQEFLNLVGGESDNVFTFVSGTSSVVSLSGAGGSDKVVHPVADAAQLSDTQLSVTGFGTISLNSIERAELTGDNTGNFIDAHTFTGTTKLFGGSGNDTIYGGAGNDWISGEAGNDSITGGDGNDLLTGSSGNDTIAAGTGTDTIEETATASLTLTATGMTGLGTDVLSGLEHANLFGTDGAAHRFKFDGWAGSAVVHGGTGSDTVEVAGTGQFISKTGAVSLTGVPDVTYTGVEAVALTGKSGNDTFTIQGGPATVSVTGGTGTDLLFIDQLTSAKFQSNTLTITGGQKLKLSGLETIQINGTSGDDVLILSGYTGKVSLNGGEGGDQLVGGSGADSLDGGGGSDSLNGGGGADTLTGGVGQNTVDGGTGRDVLVETGDSDFYFQEINLTKQLVGVGVDSYLNVELARLTGGASANSLDASGFAGSVTLNGAGGPDTLIGTANADQLIDLNGGTTLQGGAGSDVYTLGGIGLTKIKDSGGSDLLDFSSSAKAIDLDLGLKGSVQNVTDTLSLKLKGDIEKVTGTILADHIVGNKLANIIDGGKGNDTILGKGGLDRLTGNDGDDELEGGKYNDNLDGGAGNDTLVGDAGNDFFKSGAGNDSIVGGDGYDSITTNTKGDVTLTATTINGEGNDIFDTIEYFAIYGDSASNKYRLEDARGKVFVSGGAGDDTVFFGKADIKFDGGTGTNAADFAASTKGIKADLVSGIVRADGMDTLSRVTVVFGSDKDDSLAGSDRNELFFGRGGDDTLLGGAGDDTLDGGPGIDYIDGGLGHDTAFNGEIVKNVP